MNKNKNFHVELSERKLLLRFLDAFLTLLGIQFIGTVFDFEYFTFYGSILVNRWELLEI